MQKIIAMISGKTLDALITDDTYMDHNLEAGLFCDLHQYFTDEAGAVRRSGYIQGSS